MLHVASIAERVSNIGVGSERQAHRNVSFSRCPVRRPRLYWPSWKLPTVGHCSVEHARRVDTFVFQPCQKGQRAAAWINPGHAPLQRLPGFRPDHSRPAMSTSENARLRLPGAAVHTGVLAYLFSVLFHNLQVPADH